MAGEAHVCHHWIARWFVAPVPKGQVAGHTAGHGRAAGCVHRACAAQMVAVQVVGSVAAAHHLQGYRRQQSHSAVCSLGQVTVDGRIPTINSQQKIINTAVTRGKK